jgi:MYXO-CTERM domain-containing protein
VVRCSSGRRCELDLAGEPSCVSEDPPKRGQPIYAAGGGCQVDDRSGGRGGTLIMLLGALMLAARRRRAC